MYSAIASVVRDVVLTKFLLVILLIEVFKTACVDPEEPPITEVWPKRLPILPETPFNLPKAPLKP